MKILKDLEAKQPSENICVLWHNYELNLFKSLTYFIIKQVLKNVCAQRVVKNEVKWDKTILILNMDTITSLRTYK